MTSQPGLQRIALHKLPNISQSKGNQTLKFGQLIEHCQRNTFLQQLCGNEAGRPVLDLLLLFKKA